jgi:hypothetical protein
MNADAAAHAYAVMMAGFLPRAIPCVITNRLSGPGAIVRAMDAPRKQSRVEVSCGITFKCVDGQLYGMLKIVFGDK